jgi:YidC/Oxa1 family membrane protein insertase
MSDRRNVFIAIVLGLAILLGWEYFVVGPRQHELAQQQAQSQAVQPSAAAPGASPAPGMASTLSRDAALAQSPRVPIANSKVSGSINLHGGRIDDLRLTEFHETVDKSSPSIVLLSPSRTPEGYFAEFGWLAPQGTTAPGPDTVWTAPPDAKLTPETPVTLTFDNGAGLVFTRKITLDQAYMFSVTDVVTNKAGTPVTLTPYGRVVRLGEPKTAGSYILHEGPIGVFGAAGLNAPNYKDLKDKPALAMTRADSGWLGFTDKYWAVAMVPGGPAQSRDTRSWWEMNAPDWLGGKEPPAAQARPFESRFARLAEPNVSYQADFQQDAVTVAAGGSAEAANLLFAGAKQVALVNSYRDGGIDRFDLLIDWGWFYFITKPMFFVIDWFYSLFGNYGVAIVAVAVVLKILFFPFANRSYRSMAKMQQLEPQVAEIRGKFVNEGEAVKEIMALYKRESVPVPSGCLPILSQMLVFFGVIKVTVVAFDFRHAPFFGWIRDLSAPDPTSIFNLFGLLAFDPHTLPVVAAFAAIGTLPMLGGLTLWALQRSISPTLLPPFQRVVYVWLPVIVIFVCSGFSSALLIGYVTYNILSILHLHMLTGRHRAVVGNIKVSSGELLPYSRVQPIVLLMLLAPIIQHPLTFLVFWRPIGPRRLSADSVKPPAQALPPQVPGSHSAQPSQNQSPAGGPARRETLPAPTNQTPPSLAKEFRWRDRH